MRARRYPGMDRNARRRLRYATRQWLRWEPGKKLPKVQSNMVVTAAMMNILIAAVNDLRRDVARLKRRRA